MRKIILFFFIIIPLFAQSNSSYALWNKKYLLKIDGKSYTKKDFKIWWKYWKEPGMSFPKTPDPFINWVLISREAKTLGLQEDPSYKRKLLVFLKVRSLLQLKYEEVDSKIKITPKDLWNLYKEKYAPLLKLKALVTSNKKEMGRWKKEIHSEQDFLKYFEFLHPQKKAKNLGWKRPKDIPLAFKKALLNCPVHTIKGPLFYHKAYYLFLLEKKIPPKKEDFKKLKKLLIEELRKKEEEKLTEDLINRLKKKYKVWVDYKLLTQINLTPLPKNLENKILLRINNLGLNALEFQKRLKKEVDLRFHFQKPTSEEIKRLKQMMIKDTIAQTLTSWEALNRHYEKRPPLKEAFEFYKKERLVKEWEEKIIAPQIKITEQDLKAYYKAHRKRFSLPPQVEIAVIRTRDIILARLAYKKLKQGEDFFEVGKEILFHGVRPERYSLKQLVPKMRREVERLRPGQFSPIIKIKGEWYCIVKLLKRLPARTIPFEKVKEHLRKELFKRRFLILKEEYLKKLRAHSVIKINKKAWQELEKEMRS